MRNDSRGGTGAAKEAVGRRLLGAMLIALATAACSSGLDCIEQVPPGHRADVVRYVVDRRMVSEDRIPRADRELGRTQGKLYQEQSEERRREISQYAVGYKYCLDRHWRK
jgi:hypothetical protein